MDRDACPGAFIPVKLLEEVVLRKIKCLSSEYLDREALSTAIAFQNPLEAKRKVLENTISSRKKKLREVRLRPAEALSGQSERDSE